jgi:hypothetical protein
MTDVFNSEDLKLLSSALDRAQEQFHAARNGNGDSEAVVRAALTRALLEAADAGERDETKLVAYALAHYERTKTALQTRDR